jgi:hypothetical protein
MSLYVARIPIIYRLAIMIAVLLGYAGLRRALPSTPWFSDPIVATPFDTSSYISISFVDRMAVTDTVLVVRDSRSPLRRRFTMIARTPWRHYQPENRLHSHVRGPPTCRRSMVGAARFLGRTTDLPNENRAHN